MIEQYLLGQLTINTSGPLNVFFDTMVDARLADKIAFEISSTLPDPIAMYLVGSFANMPREASHLHRIGNSLVLPAGNTSYQMRSASWSRGDNLWYPWIGLYGRTLRVDGAGNGILTALVSVDKANQLTQPNQGISQRRVE